MPANQLAAAIVGRRNWFLLQQANREGELIQLMLDQLFSINPLERLALTLAEDDDNATSAAKGA